MMKMNGNLKQILAGVVFTITLATGVLILETFQNSIANISQTAYAIVEDGVKSVKILKSAPAIGTTAACILLRVRRRIQKQ